MRYSITIPAYKIKFLKECIDSVLCQTYTDFELIILNDCSPEPLKEIVSSFDDPRIKYYENESNKGVVHVVENWNKLLYLAQGEFIICMGDDDLLMPNALQIYNKLLDEYPGYLVYHLRTALINEDSQITKILDDKPNVESIYALAASHNDGFFIGNYLFKTCNLRKCGGFVNFPMALASDWATVFLMAKEKGLVHSHEIGFLYRVNQYTITSSGNSKIQAEANLKYEEWLKNFFLEPTNNKIDEFYRTWFLANLHTHLSSGRGYFLAKDLSDTCWMSLFFWLRNRKKYGLNWKIFFVAIIRSFSYKMSL